MGRLGRTGDTAALEAEPPPAPDSEDLPTEDAERSSRRLSGTPGLLVGAGALGVTLFALHQAYRPLAQGSQYYLVLFLAGSLPLVFLAYGPRAKASARPSPLDWVLAAVAFGVCAYPVAPWPGGGYDDFLDRQGRLNGTDTLAGLVLLLLILEGVRRTAGMVLPVICLAFLAYGYYGGSLPQSWPVAHAGLDVDQIVDALYNSGSGFFGTPLDVAGTFIVLFSLYGAVLAASGAGAFFVDLSAAIFRRSRSAAARSTVTAGLLLGTVSGSGTATAVTVGSTTWPVLRRAGYSPERAAGMLAASGVGAILSPPTLGAAAFIVAEYVGVSYLTVVGWALIPALLYYLGIGVAVELDARRTVHAAAAMPAVPWARVLRRSHHLASLIVVVVLLVSGATVTRSVLWGTAVAFASSFLEPGHALTPRRLLKVGADTTLGMLAVTAVCASAGVITAITTKTGLGGQVSSLVVDGAELFGDAPVVVLTVTALLSAFALVLLGLAVPVTASFIIGWAVIGPALLALDVPAPAVAMFVFYFSVLSEVTPPTALAAVGACAVTGGRPMPAMVAALRYALPAFVVPLAIVCSARGEYLLGRGPLAGTVLVLLAAVAAIVALAIAVGPVSRTTRLPATLAVPCLLSFSPVAAGAGALFLLVAVAALRTDRSTAPVSGGPA
ncbi:MAG: TRAP transporter permease [Sporichthyaceae bacterium]